MFRDAKVEDRVWSLQAGYGTIVHVGKGGGNNIAVQADVGGGQLWYTDAGCYYAYDSFPSLFWDEIKIPDRTFEVEE